MVDPLIRVLTEARRTANLSQVTVARLIHTSQPAISKLEAGKASPTLRLLAKYAAAVGYRLTAERTVDE